MLSPSLLFVIACFKVVKWSQNLNGFHTLQHRYTFSGYDCGNDSHCFEGFNMYNNSDASKRLTVSLLSPTSFGAFPCCNSTMYSPDSFDGFHMTDCSHLNL